MLRRYWKRRNKISDGNAPFEVEKASSGAFSLPLRNLLYRGSKRRKAAYFAGKPPDIKKAGMKQDKPPLSASPCGACGLLLLLFLKSGQQTAALEKMEKFS